MDEKLRELEDQRDQLYVQFRNLEAQITAIKQVMEVKNSIVEKKIKKQELLNVIKDLSDE